MDEILKILKGINVSYTVSENKISVSNGYAEQGQIIIDDEAGKVLLKKGSGKNAKRVGYIPIGHTMLPIIVSKTVLGWLR